MPTAYPTELKVKTICRYKMKVSLPHQVLYSTIIPEKLHLFLMSGHSFRYQRFPRSNDSFSNSILNSGASSLCARVISVREI